MRLGQSPVERIPVKRWLEEWLAAKKPMLAPASHRAYTHAAEEFLAYLGETGASRRLESISERDVEGFVAQLRKTGRGPRTINRIREYLSGGFEKARRVGRIPYNPFAAVERKRAIHARRATFSASAIAALLKVADPDWQGAILFGYSTGARLGDVANLRWSNLDIANGVTVFRERKTARQAIIGLHGDFLDWLSERPVPQDPDAFVFASLAGKSTGGNTRTFQCLHGSDRKAGLQNPLLREGNEGRATGCMP